MMRPLHETSAWKRQAVRHGLLSPETGDEPDFEPTLPVLLMAFLGALLCLLCFGIFLVITFGDAWIFGAFGVVLGAALLALSLALMQRQSTAQFTTFLHCVGWIAWAVGSVLLLLNSPFAALSTAWDWAGIFAIAFVVCGVAAARAAAQWLQMLLGLGLGIALYGCWLSVFFDQAAVMRWQGLECLVALAWGYYLLVEPERLRAYQQGRTSVVRHAVLVDAAVIGVLMMSMLVHEVSLMDGMFGGDSHLAQDWAPSYVSWIAILKVLLAGVGMGFVWRQRRLPVNTSLLAAWCLITVIFCVMAWFVPSVSSIVLFAVVAIVGARWKIAIFCAGLGLVLLFGFYDNLAIPLADKGLGLIALGLILGGSAFGLIRGRFNPTHLERRGDDQGQRYASASPRVAVFWMVLALVMALSLVNWDVYRKQQVIEHGQRVLVPLVPVDPRSLMQGDYMDLRFELPAMVQSELQDSLRSTRYVRAQVGPSGVVTLMNLVEPTHRPASDEVILPLKRLKGRWVLVTDAYFFPEGMGAAFEQARYGEFRVAANGKALLVGLADAQGVRMTLP